MSSLEDKLRARIAIEILHNLHLIPNAVYESEYADNAEKLERDYEVWKEIIEEKEKEERDE